MGLGRRHGCGVVDHHIDVHREGVFISEDGIGNGIADENDVGARL